MLPSAAGRQFDAGVPGRDKIVIRDCRRTNDMHHKTPRLFLPRALVLQSTVCASRYSIRWGGGEINLHQAAVCHDILHAPCGRQAESSHCRRLTIWVCIPFTQVHQFLLPCTAMIFINTIIKAISSRLAVRPDPTAQRRSWFPPNPQSSDPDGSSGT